jgi:hypothetical protein
MWYAFKAWNSETLYGWTTYPEIAEAVCDNLNNGRDINLYSPVELGETDEEASAATGLTFPQHEVVCDDDTSLLDIVPDGDN